MAVGSAPEDVAALRRQIRELLDEADRHRMEQEILYLTAQAVSESTDLKPMLDTLVRKITERLGALFGYILLLDEKGHLRIEATAGMSVSTFKNLSITVGKGITGWVAETGTPAIVDDVSRDPRYIEGTPLTKSEMAVPLRVGGRVIGVFNLESDRVAAFSESDCRMLSVACSLAASAIYMAKLNEELRRRVGELSALYEITAELSSTLHLERLLKATLDMVGDFLRVERCSLMLLDEGSKELVLTAARGAGALRIGQVRFGVGEGIAGAAALEGKPVVVSDVTQDMRFKESILPGPPIRSMAAIPLMSEGRVAGVMTVASSEHREFTEDEVKMLYIIGSRAAVAIENARLHERARRLATMDEVTGCYNHRYMKEMLEARCRSTRETGLPVGLIMVDLDDFKQYNDRWGHPAGDAALCEVAGVLNSALRGEDIVSRYGGDEFAVITEGTDADATCRIAASLRMALKGHRFLDGDGRRTLELAASFGVASCPEHSRTGTRLISAADAALYEAKRRGGDCVVVYTSR